MTAVPLPFVPSKAIQWTFPAEVDLLHQSSAEVDQNALLDAFEPDRMRGQRLTHPPTPVADVDVPLLTNLAQLSSGTVIPSLRVGIVDPCAGPP